MTDASLRTAMERVLALAHWDVNGEASARIEQIARKALIFKAVTWGDAQNDEMLDLENPPSFDELRKAYARLHDELQVATAEAATNDALRGQIQRMREWATAFREVITDPDELANFEATWGSKS